MDNDAKGLQRSGLADVLAALSVLSRMTEEEHQRVVRAFVGPHWPFGATSTRWESGPLSGDWITTDPREALEILQTRDLAPEGDVRRAFVGFERRTEAGGLVAIAIERENEHPLTIPDIIAWASLGIPAILRAEELARDTVARLREYGAPQPERVVWRVCRRSALGTKMLGNFYQMHSREHNPVPPARDLWDMGLALDAITADAVTLVVPNVSSM